MHSLELVERPREAVMAVEKVAEQLDLPEKAAKRLAAFVASAEQALDGKDGYLGRALVEQKWDLYFDAAAFPAGVIRVPLPPLIKVEELAFETASGKLQALPEESYRVRPGEPATVHPIGFRLIDYPSFRLRFTCGYGPLGTDVPEPIRQAIVLTAAHLSSMSRPDVQLMSETVNGVGSQMWSVSSSVSDSYRQAVDNLVSRYRMPVL